MNSWGVSVYLRHEHSLLLAFNKKLKHWEPIATKIRKGETPLATASRLVRSFTGEEGYFPPIHQVMGAPAGLILYNEYIIGSKETRLGFVFLAEVNSKNFSMQGDYTKSRWVHNDHDLSETMPYVKTTLPYALMAAGLTRP